MGDKEDRIAGKVKEKAGQATGNERLESEGKVQHSKGKLKDKLNDVTDRVRGAVEGARGKDNTP
jgi:uncharacterized protein YjbJ (UPF0337 family)